jgi:transcriptional regulator with XRE-family HTH domain
MRPGRKEKELVSVGGPAANFASALRKARRQAGNPTYRKMAETAYCSGPALSQAANGAKLPTWSVTEAYLKACGIKDLAPWHNDWSIAGLEQKLARARGNNTRNAYPLQRRPTAHSERCKVERVPGPREQLLDMLNALGDAKNLSIRAIASQTKKGQADLTAQGGPAHSLSPTTINDVLSGKRPISRDFITIYLNAIGATAGEQDCVGEAIGRLDYKLQHSDPGTVTQAPPSEPGPADPPARHNQTPVAAAETLPQSAPLARGYVTIKPEASGAGTGQGRDLPTPECQNYQGTIYGTEQLGSTVQSGRRPAQGKITAAAIEDPIADSFLPRPSASAANNGPTTGDSTPSYVVPPEVASHRRRPKLDPLGLSRQILAKALWLRRQPHTIAAGIAAAGLGCWLYAFTVTAIQSGGSTMADFGSAVLITAGIVRLVIVVLLLNTVRRHSEQAHRQATPFLRQTGLRKWLYKGRHQTSPRVRTMQLWKAPAAARQQLSLAAATGWRTPIAHHLARRLNLFSSSGSLIKILTLSCTVPLLMLGAQLTGLTAFPGITGQPPQFMPPRQPAQQAPAGTSSCASTPATNSILLTDVQGGADRVGLAAYEIEDAVETPASAAVPWDDRSDGPRPLGCLWDTQGGETVRDGWGPVMRADGSDTGPP